MEGVHLHQHASAGVETTKNLRTKYLMLPGGFGMGFATNAQPYSTTDDLMVEIPNPAVLEVPGAS